MHFAQPHTLGPLSSITCKPLALTPSTATATAKRAPPLPHVHCHGRDQHFQCSERECSQPWPTTEDEHLRQGTRRWWSEVSLPCVLLPQCSLSTGSLHCPARPCYPSSLDCTCAQRHLVVRRAGSHKETQCDNTASQSLHSSRPLLDQSHYSAAALTSPSSPAMGAMLTRWPSQETSASKGLDPGHQPRHPATLEPSRLQRRRERP